jgi:dCMP deaminase
MGIAHLSALRSKDTNTKVGAVIIDNDNKVVSIGYNGFPRGVDDSKYPMNREGDYLDTKYPYIVHAELNAILNAPRSVKDCTMYVTLFPCNECAKAIIQSSITKIVFESNKYKDTDAVKASIRMLTDSGIELESISTNVQVDVSELRPWLVTGSKVVTYTSKDD